MITDPATFRYHPGPIDKQYNTAAVQTLSVSANMASILGSSS